MQTKRLIDEGDRLFSDRGSVLALWTELAENFYPERADFMSISPVGRDLASTLASSSPVLLRRELSDILAAMLRPTNQEWFHNGTYLGEAEKNVEVKRWLEWQDGVQRNAMYDPRAKFLRTMKASDNDYVTFGQSVIEVTMNPTLNGLLYRNWHLRDVVWSEDATGTIDTVHRAWNTDAGTLVSLFPRTASAKVREQAAKNPRTPVVIRHVVLPAARYQELAGGKAYRTPFVSCYLDATNTEELETVGSWTLRYVIPRWHLLGNSQYAISPVTVSALPDARTYQAIVATLLEAGENTVRPPLLATRDAIRGDISLFSGGVTWVAAEYDERLGPALKPLVQDARGMSFGLDMAQDVRNQLVTGFYTNKLTLPVAGAADMTAYETAQRLQEFIRNSLPLFEPMEVEVNGGVCEMTFQTLYHHVPEISASMPQQLRGADTRYVFESPLHDALQKAKVGKLAEVWSVVTSALGSDPTAAYQIDTEKALREVLMAIGPAEWVRSKREFDGMVQEATARQEEAAGLSAMREGADIANKLGIKLPSSQGLTL